MGSKLSTAASSASASISSAYSALQPYHQASGILYLYILILVLVLAGNLIQKGKSDKSIGWMAFSISVIIGLIGVFLLFQGKNPYIVILLNLLITSLLMTGMIMTNPDATMADKVSSHFANICFLIVTCISAYFMHKGNQTGISP